MIPASWPPPAEPDPAWEPRTWTIAQHDGPGRSTSHAVVLHPNGADQVRAIVRDELEPLRRAVQTMLARMPERR